MTDNTRELFEPVVLTLKLSCPVAELAFSCKLCQTGVGMSSEELGQLTIVLVKGANILGDSLYDAVVGNRDSQNRPVCLVCRRDVVLAEIVSQV